MDVIFSAEPLLAVLVSAFGALMILVFSRYRNIRESWTIIAGVLKFSIVVSIFFIVLQGNIVEYSLSTIMPMVPLKFRADPFGTLFATTSSFLWILTSLYSIGYTRALNEHAQTRYYFCFAIALSSTMGIAFAANLFTLFIFFEILTVATYPLVIHRETPDAMSAGRKYLAYLMTADALLLFSVVLTYSLTGSLDFVGQGFLAGQGSKLILTILFITFLVGFTKAAFMPLHSWLPSAMVAPTPVSALLHAVAVVKAGVFGIVRVVGYVYGINLMAELGLNIFLASLASFTIIAASLFALAQDNLKRRLAYSTISQLSYIILGVALLNPAGLMGGILHIVTHAFMKITLFFCAGAVYVVAHKENISEMVGIGRTMPVTMIAFTIGAFGMSGVPSTCGFISKWYLWLAPIESGQLIFLFILLISTLLNMAYFFPIISIAFFKGPEKQEKIKEAPIFMLVALVITAIATIILGTIPQALDPFLKLTENAVHDIMGA